jgi:hypothetical protein
MKCYYYTRDLNQNVSLTIITTATFAAVTNNDQHNIESATKPENYAVCEAKQKSRGSRTNWTTCTITIDIDIRRTTETVRYAAY